jgi:DHA2 family multidrug resistance protein
MHWPTALAPIDRVVQAQATIMIDLDIFWLLGVLALCLWPLALFLPQMPKRAVPAH